MKIFKADHDGKNEVQLSLKFAYSFRLASLQQFENMAKTSAGLPMWFISNLVLSYLPDSFAYSNVLIPRIDSSQLWQSMNKKGLKNNHLRVPSYCRV